MQWKSNVKNGEEQKEGKKSSGRRSEEKKRRETEQVGHCRFPIGQSAYNEAPLLASMPLFDPPKSVNVSYVSPHPPAFPLLPHPTRRSDPPPAVAR